MRIRSKWRAKQWRRVISELVGYFEVIGTWLVGTSLSLPCFLIGSGLQKVRLEWVLHASRTILCALEQPIADLLRGIFVQW